MAVWPSGLGRVLTSLAFATSSAFSARVSSSFALVSCHFWASVKLDAAIPGRES